MFTVGDESVDVWIAAVSRGGARQVDNPTPAFDGHGYWTPDGTRVVFQSQRDGSRGLFWAADDSGGIEYLMTFEDAGTLRPSGWSSDGDTLVFDYSEADTGSGIGLLSMEGERTWPPLIASEANENAPAISPNGQWIAYSSDETGERLIYLERFPRAGRVVPDFPIYAL